MTTTLAPLRLDPDAGPSPDAPIPFSRLVAVEWTKATDTRAARWLLALWVVSTVAFAAVPVLASSSFDQTHSSYLRVTAIGLTILLPVVAILLFTGEWSQRGVMTTFTQEPRRLRVVNAKLAVAIALSVGGAVVGGMVTAAGIAAVTASGRTLEADLTAGDIVGFTLFVLLNVFAAVALGALVQNSAGAIAASFALPAGISVLGAASTLVSNWIDPATTWNAVLEGEWDGRVAEIMFTLVFWVGAPLAAGVIRTLRRDVG